VALDRHEVERALVLAVAELADALGVDPTGRPGLEAVTLNARERLAADEWQRNEGKRAAERGALERRLKAEGDRVALETDALARQRAQRSAWIGQGLGGAT
jgi:hypothetical protein